MKSTTIIILGMHRSGTSALAGILNILGISMGKKLLPPNEANPKGFFENLDITYFDDYLLSLINTSWDDILPIHFDALKNLTQKKELINKGIEIIKKSYNLPSIFGIKDPRLCILFPFWEKVLNTLNVEIKVIIPFRNPVEVAYSLFHRDDFPIGKGLFLWSKYMLLAEYYSRRYKRSFVSFDELLNDPLKVLKSIQETLNLSFPNDLENKKDEILSFLEKRMKNFNFSFSNLPVNIPDFIKEVSFYLEKLSFKEMFFDEKLEDRFNEYRFKYQREIGNFHIEGIRPRKLAVQVFWNIGRGFNEKDSSIKVVKPIKNIQNFSFKIPKGAYVFSIRVDPLNLPCIVNIKRFDLLLKDNVYYEIKSFIKSNAIYKNGEDFVFLTNDPQLYFPQLPKDLLFLGEELKIEIEYKAIGLESLFFYLLNNKILEFKK